MRNRLFRYGLAVAPCCISFEHPVSGLHILKRH